MDYRKILKAYIRHVLDMEGTTFLYESMWGRPRELSEEEYMELIKAEDEACVDDGN